MSKKPSSIDEYLATLTKEQRAVLEKVRKAISSAAPRAEEVISYAIPAFKVDGQILLWFAAWKKHYIYPITDGMLRAHRPEIKKYESSKGTLKFPASEPVPYDLVKKLVKARIAELKGKR